MNDAELAESMAEFLGWERLGFYWKIQNRKTPADYNYTIHKDNTLKFFFSPDGFFAVKGHIIKIKMAFSLRWTPSNAKFLAEVGGYKNFNKDEYIALYSVVHQLRMAK